ncbi:hypothetical protein BJ944DRAFT_241201 [Cunninghamella echinulata]|nr:hypothetical protein BJ944DRAFT_241201 [Cunninghamella echinulata]
MKKRTRSITACTKCRRMKLRCNVVDKFPNKCSRCEKAKAFCEMDNQVLQHMNSNNKTKETKQLNSATILSPSETKSLITALSSTANLNKINEDNNNNNKNSNDETPTSLLPINGIFHSQSHYYGNNAQPFIQHQVLNNNSIISSSRIDQLFNLFLQYQYQYIPVFPKKYLNPKTLLYECTEYTGSEILFWTICAVSSRISSDNSNNNNDHMKEHQSISDHVKYLIQKTGMVSHYTMRPFKTLAHIYALVLLCLWPLPHRSTQEDMSWMYSGQAIHMGLLLGIHRSWFRKTEFLVFDKQHKKSNEQSRAKFHALMWMASFFVNQQLADLHGVPATATLDYSLLSEFHIKKKSTTHPSYKNKNKIKRRKKNNHVVENEKKKDEKETRSEDNNNGNSDDEVDNDEEDDDSEYDETLNDFLKQIHILHLLNRSIYTLGVDTNSTLHSHNGVEASCRKLIHTNLATNLSQLGMDFSPMSSMTELVYLHAKLQLHSFLLQPDSLDCDKISSITPTSYVCIQIINLIQSMYQQQQVKEKAYQSWPVFITRDLINASVILFRLVTSSYKLWLDEESALNALQDAHSLLKNISLKIDDPAARGARIIDKLRLMSSLGALKTDINYLQTRLGAGLFWGLLMDYKLWATKLEEEELQKQQQQEQQNQFTPSSPSNMIIPATIPSSTSTNSAFHPTSNYNVNNNNHYYNLGDDLFSLFNFDDPLLFNIDDFLVGK